MLILIVDDNKWMRRIIIRALQLSGLRNYHTLEAADGSEALKLIDHHHPDLIISDWQMPGMKGIDLLRALRRSGCGVPFGFITSESEPAMHREAFAAGASFVLTKPLASRTFESTLKPLLAEH